MKKLIYFVPRGNLASPVTSDMLFGAVCWGMRETGALRDAELNALLKDFTPPSFAFSNLFPAYQAPSSAAGTIVRFYPKPITLNAQVRATSSAQVSDPVAQSGTRKAFQSVQYLSESLLKMVLTEPGQRNRLLDPNGVKKIGHALISQAEFNDAHCAQLHSLPLTAEVMTQRNQIDRLRGSTADGLLFYEPETGFAPGARLWCLAVARDQTVWEKVEAGLRYLADTGLGANRSSGRGQFNICWQDATHLPHSPAANGVLCLSNYVPMAGEINTTAQPLGYTVQSVWPKRERRFGSETVIYKRPMRMITAGSVIPLPSAHKPIYGCLVEAVPAEGTRHAIYQSGLMVGLEGQL